MKDGEGITMETRSINKNDTVNELGKESTVPNNGSIEKNEWKA